jgi:hypothetical protein
METTIKAKQFQIVKEQLEGLTINLNEDIYGWVECTKGNKIVKHFINTFLIEYSGDDDLKELLWDSIDVANNNDDTLEKLVIKDGKGVLTYNYEIYDHIEDCGIEKTTVFAIEPKQIDEIVNLFNKFSIDNDIHIDDRYVPGKSTKYLPFEI